MEIYACSFYIRHCLCRAMRPTIKQTSAPSVVLVQVLKASWLPASVFLAMPKAKLQLHGEDRVLCQDKVKATWPHGRRYPSVLTRHTWIIRAHRGTLLRYGSEATDCQYIKVTHKKRAGQPWQKTERALALDSAAGEDGRPYLRAAVPHGSMRGNRLWARLIVWLWHRPAGMRTSQFNALDDDGQFLVQANHLNRNPHVTLVDQLEASDPDGNYEHYTQAPSLHCRKRPAHRC